MHAPGAETERGPRHGNPKVLVVDDEPDVLESTALLIESLGYPAIRLSDAGEILETVEREQPGLILQDLRMTDLNLSGLVATLRSSPSTSEIPLVFFSASRDVATTAARYDAWGYLTKPFSRSEMAGLLERVFAHHGDPHEMPHNFRADIRGLFYDQWDLLAALNNYIQILDGREDLDQDARRCVRGLDETLLKLEAKTDRMKSYVLSLVDALEPIPEQERTPKRKR